MNFREQKQQAEKEIKALDRIIENQRLISKKISDIIAIRNNQISFVNNLAPSESYYGNTLIEPELNEFSSKNLSKLAIEIKESLTKISDDIHDLI